MMDYDDWLKAGNGARRDETLEDAVARTVESAYKHVSLFCPECASSDIEMFNDHLMHCKSCGNYWSMQ
jgi:ribosomal protein L37AE/L43A